MWADADREEEGWAILLIVLGGSSDRRASPAVAVVVDLVAGMARGRDRVDGATSAMAERQSSAG